MGPCDVCQWSSRCPWCQRPTERAPLLPCGLRDTPHESHTWDAAAGWPRYPSEHLVALKTCPGAADLTDFKPGGAGK